MKLVALFLVCIVAVVQCQGPTSSSEGGEGEDRSFEVTKGLYVTLRNIAFPDHLLTSDDTIESRFLMLMPGKVLNYFDYYPGDDYVRFIKGLDLNKAEEVVPPHVMEKWFDLADNIPTFNPMNAQDSGKSLASVYASILHETRLKGLQAKTNTEEKYYSRAVEFLNKFVTDPENVTLEVPLLSLYERYRDEYNNKKLEMEDEIEEKRKSVQALDYELWFQRHYPSLNSKVESAYTKWLIFGQKETVELYITYMDTGSSGVQLEEARMSLRSSAVTSLDRTRTLYPVSFEPSDWYKYLLPEAQLPSRDQLQLMYGKIQSKIVAINEMINATKSNTAISSVHERVKREYRSKIDNTTLRTKDYVDYQLGCLGPSQSCPEYDDRRNAVVEAMLEEAEAFSTYQFAAYFNTPTDYVSHLEKERAQLTSQSRRIEGYLSSTSPYLGGLIDATPLAVTNVTDAYKDNEWLQFDYNFESYFRNQDEETTSESFKAHASVHAFFFSASVDHTYNKNTHDYSQKLALANMTVKGELLRVNIKRPWFKPEVFEMPDLEYKETGNGGEAFVSPGYMSERDLYDTLIQSNPKYKLPEFTTGFLLARKIELGFSGLDSDIVTSTMSEMSHTSGGGGFLCFSASVSETKTKDTSHVQVKRTASGMTIKIPGAQVIGYYTKVLPKFPGDQ